MPNRFLSSEAPSLDGTRRQFMVRATAAALGVAIKPGIVAIGQGQPLSMDADPAGPVRIQVQNTVLHTMAGGMGASWHAMGPTAYFYPTAYKFGQNPRDIRGSGWGGTPPTGYRQQWDDLLMHFRWLGLNFVRVEIESHMYEPERGKFDWQNDEMQVLYRILDICQNNNVEVFLTQMFQNAEWNAFPEVPRSMSAPKSVAEFVRGLGTLMEHLVHGKGYNCIKWLCIANEPADSWGNWLGPDGRPQSLMPAIRGVRAELDQRKIDVAISGPDFIHTDDFGSSIFDWNDSAVGAFDLHYYNETGKISMDWIRPLIAKARTRGIPIFLSEFGSYVGGTLDGSDPTMSACANYPNQLLNAEKVLLGLNLGVDGFSRWSFTNRGDLDGQWQLVRTWNPISWDYLPRAVPEPIPYYTYGILTRFMAKHSQILGIEVGSSRVLASALLSPAGSMTVIVLNKSDHEETVLLEIPKNAGKPDFFKYLVTEVSVSDPKYRMPPMESFQVRPTAPVIADTLPPASITVYSNYHLSSDDFGIISG